MIKKGFAPRKETRLKYRIGELTRLLGLNPQTLRRYEEQGLIHSTRDADSGYRMYESTHLSLLMQMRLYRNYGFSVRESIDLFKHDLTFANGLFGKRLDELDEEIARLTEIRRCTRLHWELLQDCEREAGTFRMALRPRTYVTNYRFQEHIMDDPVIREVAAALLDRSPPVLSHFLIDGEEYKKGRVQFSIGLHFQSSDLPDPDPFILENCQELPERLCAYTVMKMEYAYENSASQSDLAVMTRVLDKGVDYLRSRGLSLAGDITGNTVHAWHDTAGFTRYARMYFPAE